MYNKLYVNKTATTYDVIDLDDNVDMWGIITKLVYLAGLVVMMAVTASIGLVF